MYLRESWASRDVPFTSCKGFNFEKWRQKQEDPESVDYRGDRLNICPQRIQTRAGGDLVEAAGEERPLDVPARSWRHRRRFHQLSRELPSQTRCESAARSSRDPRHSVLMRRSSSSGIRTDKTTSERKGAKKKKKSAKGKGEECRKTKIKFIFQSKGKNQSN